ncbi:uncharacterized protein ARB_06301 [Trichophyton benhamiae CBS 112371]|uniref:Uncharacterized protein n=1 Tax=Arthroderma benhamiae (strain ATCC MYA-4681 / CBS 112371) TaxID=663331 RepID=D4APZ4_ARTBC|nr:uncharacterized protein ARB_06301 [Trichophyton benhamiae CBS 112371]EFE34538.1 hypothetical protein ARB_06301 [Trichophyton benhamiae CBS 112371]
MRRRRRRRRDGRKTSKDKDADEQRQLWWMDQEHNTIEPASSERSGEINETSKQAIIKICLAGCLAFRWLPIDSRSDTLYHPPTIAMGGLGEPPDTDWKNARTA